EPPGIPAGAIIQADRVRVRLNDDLVTTDVAEFEAALRRAAAPGTDSERAPWLQQAVELYAGELLAGFYEEWIFPEREHLAEQYSGALRRLARCFAAQRDLDRAIDYARRAVLFDPLREEAHRDLMRLLAAGGQRSAALRQYG